MLAEITPLLITLDEAANLERTLGALAWARRIVVVDSGSTDGSRERLAHDARISLFVRAFDDHVSQWRFALEGTGVETEWVLALDADHVLSDAIVAELRSLRPAPGVDGFEARFRYCIAGKPLRASLYPSRIVLARAAAARFESDGHTQRLAVRGRVERLEEEIRHDDRKPRRRWLSAQDGYAKAEAEKLLATPAARLSFVDRLRRAGWIAPWLVPLWCLVVKRGLLDGWAGWIYAGERAIAEWSLALELASCRLRKRVGPS